MKKLEFYLTILIAAICVAAPADAEESFGQTRQQRGLMELQRGFGQRHAPTQVVSTPLTRESVAIVVDKHVESLFDRAADPSTHLVTRASAEKSGLGFLVDHFAAIDRDHDGNLRFNEVKGFLDARSPVTAKPASGTIQIVE